MFKFPDRGSETKGVYLRQGTTGKARTVEVLDPYTRKSPPIGLFSSLDSSTPETQDRTWGRVGPHVETQIFKVISNQLKPSNGPVTYKISGGL